MEPNLSEQLSGVQHILEQRIAPEITDSYLSTQLAVVIKTLATIEGFWSQALPLMMQNNDELTDLFASIASRLDISAPELQNTDLAKAINAASIASSPAPYPNFEQLESRNLQLRSLLGEVIEALYAQATNPQLTNLQADIRSLMKTQLQREADIKAAR